jgi:hypothetical protein
MCLVGGYHGPYEDNLCFFRCLAVHRGAPDGKALEVPPKTYQVFFCSDEVWRLEESGVVLASMIIPQQSSLNVPQDKTKRQVDLEGCGLLSVQGPYHTR